ncbi:uncharacterized protein LOC126762212 isoform X2 [Bactrocera neohumeralis]|uniref:uncharacterized protein LOC126762212 isoform X2 n=1 Tax=Bactrocera neohumeralis TaxID=98809 RepID=UPI002166B245|nr:uncharacterized protein LOC126762212 isoform X2 [Bactrocera neohumeralis]
MAYVIWKIFMKQYSRFRFDLATATTPSSAALLISRPLVAPYNQPAIMANPQPSNNNVNSTSNNENNGQSGNIRGNSTSRPPEGEEHSVAILTTTTTTNTTNNCKHNCNNVNGNAEEHLAEVLVMPVNDTKAITATTTTAATITETATVAEATKSRTNTADESHEAGLNSWNCGNVANAATKATNEANIMAEVRSTGATAPIAQEEDDAEEIWYSGEEDGGRDAELVEKQQENCCCLVNDNERCCQVDIDLNINAIATTTTTATTTEKPVQRSKSRVRTYLKRCRDRLTGQHQQAVANATNSTAATTTTETTATKMYVQDEKCQESIGVEVSNAARSRSTQQFAALEEKKEEEAEAEAEGAYEEVENKACTTTLIATTERQGDVATHTLLTPTALAMQGEHTSGEEASLGPDEEAHLTSEQSVLAYDDIDFSLPSSSVLMDSGSSNVSADQQQQQQQTTPLTSAEHKRDTLALAAAEVEVEVDDSADLTVEQETRQMQQQTQSGMLKYSTVAADVARVKLLQQQQSLMSISSSCPPLVKEEQLACAIHMDSGTAALIDKHLAAIYPVYTACTRSILIRQARDLLVCSYLGCLQSFEMEFLCKFAEIAAELRQRHAVGVNVLWRKGWPLTTPTGEVILHLGALDDALVRPGDLYLCVKSVDKTETPQLHVVWRNASNGLQIQQQQTQRAHASATATFAICDAAAAATTIQSHCIDFNATTTTTATAVATTPPTHLSALTLEMLTSDELPQLLQHLLVGVEHSIERVSLNELQMPASTTAATATVPLASDEANNNGKCIGNNNNNISSSGGAINSSLMRCSNNNTITNSPKCALRRSELITKNKVLNNKFMLRRLTNRQDSMNSTSSGQSCGSSGSTSSEELLRCNGSHQNSYNNNTNNNNNNISSPCGNANTSDPLKMSAGATNSASTSPALPLFCLGNSFPHIDSDEENADEKRSAHGEDQFECEIVPPASISEIPEKLLTTSGIYLPGTTDLKGHPIVTVDAECVLAAGLNCYEIATVLLFYSTIPERVSTANANDRATTQQQQPSMQQQQTQHSHQESPAEPAFVNRPSTPKMASAATAATSASGNSASVSVTSNVTTATVTAAKSPAHVTADSNNATNSNDSSYSGSSGSHGAATPTFTILIAIEKSGQMCVIDLICQSLRLLTRQIAYCEILAVCLEHKLLLEQQQQQQQQQHSAFGNNTAVSSCANGENNESCIKEQQQQQQQQAAATQQKQHSLKFISVNEVTTSVAPSQIPYGKLQGLHHHDARKWREFFVALEPFQRQCATAGQRLVAAMSDIRSADLQGLPTRRQLYAQHRALSRALMDSELHNLRKRGALQLARLQELAKAFALVAAAPTDAGENSHNRNGNISVANSSNNNNTRYCYGSSSSGAGGVGNSNRHSSSNKLLSTISSISHLGFGGSYSFGMTHQQQQQQSSQSRPAASKYSTMTSCDAISRPTVAANATVANNAVAADNCMATGNVDVAIRLHKVTLLFNEVDRAAKRLEQLTEQRRERLRELTRQRALEDEINEVTSWITSDGNDTLQRFASLQLDSESAIKEQEQEFEKYYFISMKHLAKGRDLHDAAVNIEPLRESAVNLKSALDCFAEKLELARERIEAATRLYQLLLTHQLEAHLLQEAQRLAEISGATQLLKKFRQEQRENSNNEPTTDQTELAETTNNNKNNKPNSLNLTLNYRSNSVTSSLTKQQQLQQQLQHVAVITSTPLPRMNRLSHRSSSGIGSFDGQTCQCWRESRNMEDMDEMLDADGEELEMEDGEEEQSKVADSGVGGCERCEGNLKLTRVCSCQSLNEAVNLYSKGDELDFECYERPIKHYNDIHSPMEANAHLQYHASSLELSKLDEISCLDPKIQKTLLLIMREMIGTERDYVHSLNYVIENYVDELLREDIPQPLRGQRNVIFGNIEKIFEFHKWHFLNELERYERNPLKVGSAFLEMESKFYLYALYNKNKPKSDTLMSEYGTAFFKSKQFELNDKMDLASYLLKPVQRMGKYALLLQQLVKACNSVEGAALQEIAADVEELHRAEEMVKFQLRHGNDLLAMDSLRDCDVNVKEQGRLLRQNEFLVWQGRTGRKSLRQVFLFEDLVLFSKARRFPDQKNLDIYIYKNSIKTSDIGLTAHVGDSKTKFEIWFRKRKPEDTWTLQCMSEDIKNAWAEEISKLLWKQANRNREIRLAEMSSMGIGSKPCLDIRPSNNQINDRSITISQLGKAPKLRHSFAGMQLDVKKDARRPSSFISESSLSSGTSSSSLSTGSSSGHERVVGNACNSKTTPGAVSSHHALELINETQTLTLSGVGGATAANASASGTNTNTLSSSGSSGHSGRSGSGKSGAGNGSSARAKRSTTLVSQLSMENQSCLHHAESGILSDISMTPDHEPADVTTSWLNATTKATTKSSPNASGTAATVGDSTVIFRRHRFHLLKHHPHHKELNQQQQSTQAALTERISMTDQCNP